MSGLGCKTFYRCQCFLSKNYYSPEYNVHLEYFDDDDRFLQDNSELLRKQGCETKEKIQKLLSTVKSEFRRRSTIDSESERRKKRICHEYVPLHSEIYFLKEEFFDEKFMKVVEYSTTADATRSGLLHLLKKEQCHQVYRLPVFTAKFCQQFIEELENFEQSELPKGRPNTMNNGGILLDEIGFYQNFISPLREKYLNPIASVLFPDLVGKCLDSHKAFTVKYKDGEDLDLGFHFDNAEVTINICLGKEFEDGSLYFGDMKQRKGTTDRYWEIKHSIGEGILHRGQHMHGAMPISSGERINLIVWMRSSSVRNSLCPMCDHKPVLMAADNFGDGFTKEVPIEVEMCYLT